MYDMFISTQNTNNKTDFQTYFGCMPNNFNICILGKLLSYVKIYKIQSTIDFLTHNIILLYFHFSPTLFYKLFLRLQPLKGNQFRILSVRFNRS